MAASDSHRSALYLQLWPSHPLGGTGSFLLSGCAQQGPAVPLPAPGTDLAITPSPGTGSSTSTPTTKARPPSIIGEECRSKLRMEIRNWKDAACGNAAASPVCAEAMLGVQRLSAAAGKDLEEARPWPTEQAETVWKLTAAYQVMASTQQVSRYSPPRGLSPRSPRSSMPVVSANQPGDDGRFLTWLARRVGPGSR